MKPTTMCPLRLPKNHLALRSFMASIDLSARYSFRGRSRIRRIGEDLPVIFSLWHPMPTTHP